MPIQVWGVRNSTEVFLATVTNNSTTTTSALGSDVTQIRIYDFTGFTSRGPLLATVTASSPSTGGGGSSSDSTAAPQTFELSLTPTNGTTCRNSSQPGIAGTWVNLPAANDCTPPATKPNAKLLGWATSSDFPVAIAKRQVDNGWGAYETFNDAGQLTGVFIPAGGATFVSAAGKLYAIWNE